MRARAAVATLWLLALAGCREGVPPFTPAERETGGPSFALTFGRGQDADPRWSPQGDTVLYHTDVFNTMPQSNGVLLGISVAGGPAAPVFPAVQSTAGPRPLATPAYSPSGDRIAYMDLMSVDVPDAACMRTGPEPLPLCRSVQPLLDSAVLRVRRVGEEGTMLDDPSLPVRFAGTDAGHRFGSDGPWYETLFPFQAAHRTEAAMLFRPSWAPDGERIAFSDGLSVHVWTIGDPTSSVVPGTEDGVSAAWSPDGEWIAFTAMPRADSTVRECLCTDSTPLYQTVYGTGPRMLVIIRPDGSGRIELGEGEDPAWSPDGEFIYVRRDDMIVRIPSAGGDGVPVANTERGRAPAVSPDGQRLAFSRWKPQSTLDYDIWVVSLAQ